MALIIKDLEKLDPSVVQREFLILLDRCTCSRSALEGKCTPKTCYPFLYYAIFKDKTLEIYHRQLKGNTRFIKRIPERFQKELPHIMGENSGVRN